MKANQLVLAACAALILTSACGGGGGAGGGGGGGVDVQALLQGTWTGDCLALGSTSTRSMAVFTGLSLSTSMENWSGNTTCSGTPTSSFGPYPSTYALGAAVTAPLGVASVTAHQFDHLDTSGTFYDLVHVDQGSTPNRLYFGDSGGANDGSTPALRPTALDATASWHR